MGTNAILRTLLVLALCACSATDSRRVAAETEPLRVLLLGDSISIGYTPHVREILGDRAVVIRPMKPDGSAENCLGTNKGVAQVERWLELEGGNFDVIHFNFGLHDLKRIGPKPTAPEAPPQADLTRYEDQLTTIATRLCATGAHVIFATTTPIPSGKLDPYRAVGDSDKYNAVARRVAAKLEIPINDLHAVAAAQDLPLPGNVHFDAAGYRLLAEHVATAILSAAGRARP